MTNFPDQWQNTLERNVTTGIEAPWLDGIAELNTDIIEVGSGSASEQNMIHIPTSDFEVEVLVNNSAYPIAIQDYSDSEVILKLDKFQTKVTNLSDDQINGASHDRISDATAQHTAAILKNKYVRAAHALAPASNTTKTPIVVTKGNGKEVVGERLKLTYEALVALKDACDKAVPFIPEIERRLVLCKDHENDILLDRERFGINLADYNAGTIAPVIAGFKLYSYLFNPIFDTPTKTKIPFGSLATANQFQGSFVFCAMNCAKKTGLTKLYFLPSNSNPTAQTNQFAVRHYFVAMPKRVQHMAAIVSAVKV